MEEMKLYQEVINLATKSGEDIDKQVVDRINEINVKAGRIEKHTGQLSNLKKVYEGAFDATVSYSLKFAFLHSGISGEKTSGRGRGGRKLIRSEEEQKSWTYFQKQLESQKGQDALSVLYEACKSAKTQWRLFSFVINGQKLTMGFKFDIPKEKPVQEPVHKIEE